jgi:hypothetical protein
MLKSLANRKASRGRRSLHVRETDRCSEPLHAAEISGIFRCTQTTGPKFPPQTVRRFPMATPQSPQSTTDDSHSKAFDEKDAIFLEQVAEKLVRLGQQVGVTPEEMISLLDSGITIKDLFAFLVSKASGAA